MIRNWEKKLGEEKELYEIQHYLLVTPEKEDDVFFVDYWITNGPEANEIRPGTNFIPLSDPVPAYSLTKTTGGKYAPPVSQKDRLFQQSIAKNSLLVTDNDIKDFCLKEFKESIHEVRVCRGFEKSGNPKLGFVETTDVYLKPVEGMNINEKDREYYLQMLVGKSPATFNYRVFIKEILPI